MCQGMGMLRAAEAGTPTADDACGASGNEAARQKDCREQLTPETASALPRIGPKMVAAKACCWTIGSATASTSLRGFGVTEEQCWASLLSSA